MARFEGKSLVVMVENSSSAEVAFTFVVGATVNFEYAKVVTEGDDEQAALAGQLMSEVIVDYEYDDTSTTGNHAVLSGIDGDNTNPRMIRVRPIGTGSGLTQFSMDSALVKWGPTGVQRGERVMGQATFKLHANATATPAWAGQ